MSHANASSIRFVLLCGVMASGKTAVGLELAKSWGENTEFHDADKFHPEANVSKMRSGVPLTDEDRFPWLKSLHDAIEHWVEDDSASKSTVLACSALKRSYRKILFDGIDPGKVRVVHLKARKDTLISRAATRQHFMPVSLLDSQLATWESPEIDENILEIQTDDMSVAEIVNCVVNSL